MIGKRELFLARADLTTIVTLDGVFEETCDRGTCPILKDQVEFEVLRLFGRNALIFRLDGDEKGERQFYRAHCGPLEGVIL